MLSFDDVLKLNVLDAKIVKETFHGSDQFAVVAKGFTGGRKDNR